MGGLLSPENRRAFSRGLLDATQAASNSAASTVSAPVDALAWVLRKAGVPIPQAPFGGSDWMKAQGLTRDVQSPVANAVGETIGGVLPIVAAAKAPQIAGGLLKAAENASAKAPMNAATRNQAGAIVWHGSPHKFDRFDASKIGTGEGAQVYGHGLYVAESPDVAKGYKDTLAYKAFDLKPEAEARGLTLSAGARGEFIRQAQANVDPAIAARRLQNANISARGLPQDKLADLFAAYQKEGGGQLYKVDLPDDQIAKMLDWDKPLSEQAPGVRSLIEQERKRIGGGASTGEQAYRELMFEARMQGDKSATNAMRNNAEALAASRRLQELGIPGIRYLDGGSRSAGSGSSNFVVFPGNEGLLNILERNGQPIR
jgi:hypothetical protein